MRYTYRGDRLTSSALKGIQCDPVRRADGKCVRAKPYRIDGKTVSMGTMLVVDASGKQYAVIGRQLRVNR